MMGLDIEDEDGLCKTTTANTAADDTAKFIDGMYNLLVKLDRAVARKVFSCCFCNASTFNYIE